MGLKQDLIDAKVKALKESGVDVELDTRTGSMIKREAEYTKEAIVNFLTECDFTITVSNTNAHLSASIGQTTYLLLPKEVGKFWYWENELNNKNLWYPSIKKISQTTKQNWSDPIKKLEKILNPKKEILN